MVRNDIIHQSPFFEGAYSYQVGGITENDYRALEHPISHSIYFAGEAFARWKFGYTHSAYDMGLASAKNITKCMNNGKCQPDSPDFITKDCVSSSSPALIVKSVSLFILISVTSLTGIVAALI